VTVWVIRRKPRTVMPAGLIGLEETVEPTHAAGQQDTRHE
jgi:hypothetical protein